MYFKFCSVIVKQGYKYKDKTRKYVKLYMHAYLTLDFTNMAVRRLLLADTFLLSLSFCMQVFSCLHTIWFCFANGDADFYFSLRLIKATSECGCSRYFLFKINSICRMTEKYFQIKFVVNILDVFYTLMVCTVSQH